MKKRLTGYTFDASAKTVTHASFSDVTLAGIQLITNVTDNIIIYQFSSPTKGGTLATDTLTLTYDTTTMSDTDELMILVEDGEPELQVDVVTSALPTGAATSAKQDTIIGHVDGIETAIASTNTKLDTVNTNLGTIDGRVDGLETLVTSTNTKLDTVNTNLGTIDGRVDGLETSNSAIQTAVELIDDTVKVLGTDTYTETTTKGLVIGAVRRDADTTLVNTTNEITPLQVDANGRLKVEAFSGETLPVSFTGSGDVATQTTLASLLTSSQLIDDTVFTDDTSTHATGTTKGLGIMAVAAPTDTALNANDIGMPGMTANRELYASVTTALPAGTNAIGKLAANSGVDIGDVDVLTINGVAPAFGSGVRGATVQRVTIATDDVVPASQSGTWTVQPGNTANTTAWLVNDNPVTSGGLSTFHLVGAATDNATNVKASAGQVYSITAFNLNASPRYLKFHNTAGTPTAGSGVVRTVLIPGNTSGAGAVINIDKGLAFSTGIGISIVTGIADSNTTAISASEVVVDIGYK